MMDGIVREESEEKGRKRTETSELRVVGVLLDTDGSGGLDEGDDLHTCESQEGRRESITATEQEKNVDEKEKERERTNPSSRTEAASCSSSPSSCHSSATAQ